ncbi:SDR family NAD(P)-dependent oxidoreductase [Streptosporangium sp. NPDC020145]|uniref:SDR family NAD(P)-dependent oxidoreductase n=1 Tax=Streptosporangium sp. NPDC020145 TaxID=3154694 RepID=UPI0034490304
MSTLVNPLEGPLKDRVALVTGGGSGIGEAICRRLDADGATVVVLDRVRSAAELTAGTLRKSHALVADVSDSASVDAAVAEVAATHGRLDILVNNAGVRGGQEAEDAFARLDTRLDELRTDGTAATTVDATVSISDEAWRDMIAVHLDGTFYCTRAALRVMTGQRSGVVVNVSSICGLTGCEHLPHYSAAKGGIQALTRAVARDVAPYGIRVNCVAPGYIETPLGSVIGGRMRADLEERIALGRFGLPREIADTVAFLAGEGGSYFTGQTLSPNGGLVIA